MRCDACAPCKASHLTVQCPNCRQEACRHHRAAGHPFSIMTQAERDEWHRDAIKAAGEYAARNPHLVDDYSDADAGL